MKKLNYIILCLIILFASCTAQTSPKNEIYNKDFNWRITLPKNFDTVSATEWTKMQNKGIDAVEKTFDEKVDNQAKTIFVFKSDKLNYFESNYQPFDTATDGSYLEACNSVHAVLYETFLTQMPGVIIDTIASIQKIDDLAFNTYEMKVTYPNNMVLHAHMFSMLFGKKDFSVNIMYVDNPKGELMLDAWKKSKFGKD